MAKGGEMEGIKEYITVRVDEELKAALVRSSESEHRSLSNLSRLLLEYAFRQYRRAGSLHDLLHSQKELSLTKG